MEGCGGEEFDSREGKVGRLFVVLLLSLLLVIISIIIIVIIVIIFVIVIFYHMRGNLFDVYEEG